MDIAERIIFLRKERGYTTNKLANLSGISQSYLREIELGNKNPTVEVLSYICDALGVTLEVFFAEEDSAICPALLSSIQQLTPDQQHALANFIRQMKHAD